MQPPPLAVLYPSGNKFMQKRRAIALLSLFLSDRNFLACLAQQCRHTQTSKQQAINFLQFIIAIDLNSS